METIRTPRLILSPPTTDDVGAIYQACQDPDIQRWTTVPSPYSWEDAAGFVTFTKTGWQTGENRVWGIRLDNKLIGTIGLVDEGAGGAELGFWLAPDARNAGYMFEAARAVCDAGFQELKLQRITWHAYIGNSGSPAIAQKLGFTYEGLIRLGAIHRGQRRDQLQAGLLATDDQSEYAAIDTWPTTLRR